MGAALTAGQALAVVMAGEFLSGAIMAGTWKGGLMGAFSAAAFYGVGRWASQLNALNATRVGMHAMTGGIVEHLQGGKFGHGFVSAGLSKAAMPAINTNNTYADATLVALAGGAISTLTGGKFANGASSAAMQFAFNQLTQRATFQARTVTVPDDLELTDGDRKNIAGINEALRAYGLAAYASGDAEAISDYNTAELIYDPRMTAEIDAQHPDAHAAAYAYGTQNKIIFGRGREANGVGPWTRSRYGTPDGSLTYANAIFFPMTGRAMRAWMVAHEFGHLHSDHSPIPKNLWATEVRANAFARKMTPHMRSAAGITARVLYGPED